LATLPPEKTEKPVQHYANTALPMTHSSQLYQSLQVNFSIMAAGQLGN